VAYRTSVAANTSPTGTTLQTGNVTSVVNDIGVACWTTTQGQPVSSYLDSNGNTWNQVSGSPYAFGSTIYYFYVYLAVIATGGSTENFTCSVSGGATYLVQNVGLFSGRNTSSTLDGTLGTFLDSGFVQPHSGPSVTTTSNGSDLVCCVVDYGQTTADTFTAGSGFTIGCQFNGNGTVQMPMMMMYQQNVAAGTYTAPWTTANFVKGGAVMIALKAATTSFPTAQGDALSGGLSGGFKF